MKISFLFLMMVATLQLSVESALACPVYKVFYVPLDVKLYSPLVSVEDQAFRKFEIKSCSVQKLFLSFKKNQEVKKEPADIGLYRIKVKASDQDFFYIDEMKRIVAGDQVQPISEDIKRNVLREIDEKAHKVKSKKGLEGFDKNK